MITYTPYSVDQVPVLLKPVKSFFIIGYNNGLVSNLLSYKWRFLQDAVKRSYLLDTPNMQSTKIYLKDGLFKIITVFNKS